MLNNILIALAKILLGDVFKKHPWALWGMQEHDKIWKKIGVGSYRRLKLFADNVLFPEGWRTLICAIGITPPAPPIIFTPENSKDQFTN